MTGKAQVIAFANLGGGDAVQGVMKLIRAYHISSQYQSDTFPLCNSKSLRFYCHVLKNVKACNPIVPIGRIAF